MTSPLLSVDAGEKIGRLYRRPGDVPAGVIEAADGSYSVRAREAAELVSQGLLVPSVTNVLGVRSAPHLMSWAARMITDRALSAFQAWPDRVRQDQNAARRYIKSAADDIRDTAAARGDRVHQACEARVLGEPIPAGLNDDERACVAAFDAWCDAWQPEFIATEATVFGETDSGLGYGGTADTMFRCSGATFAGDYKTTRSGLHDDVAMQLSAVVHAARLASSEGELVDAPRFDAAVGIHLSPEGFQVRPVVLDADVWSMFCSLRDVWDAHVFQGCLRDGRRMLGPSVPNAEAAAQYAPFTRP